MYVYIYHISLNDLRSSNLCQECFFACRKVQIVVLITIHYDIVCMVQVYRAPVCQFASFNNRTAVWDWSSAFVSYKLCLVMHAFTAGIGIMGKWDPTGQNGLLWIMATINLTDNYECTPGHGGTNSVSSVSLPFDLTYTIPITGLNTSTDTFPPACSLCRSSKAHNAIGNAELHVLYLGPPRQLLERLRLVCLYD